MKKYLLTTNYRILDNRKYIYELNEFGRILLKKNAKYLNEFEGDLKEEADSPFDFIDVSGDWAVRDKYNNLINVKSVGYYNEKIYDSDCEFDYKIEHYRKFDSIREDLVINIYHKDSQGNWEKVWSKENSMARRNIYTRENDDSFQSECPACGGLLYEECNIIFKYCPWCTQKLDNEDFNDIVGEKK